MDKYRKTFEHILMRRSDANVSFRGLCSLLRCLGFQERIKGDHHIFSKQGVAEILNLQPKGGNAKPYQVKQVRDLIHRYNFHLGE